MPGFDRPQDVYTAVATRVRAMVEEDLNNVPSPEQVEEFHRAFEEKKMVTELPAYRYCMAQLFPPERVERKTVKQTVMTTVYGVTRIGARDQVLNRLKEKYPGVYDERQMARIAGYLAPKIFSALEDMFQGARKIQDWLAAAAGEIARSVPRDELAKTKILKHKMMESRKENRRIRGRESTTASTAHTNKVSLALNSNSSVVWTTPLDFVVVQPYRSSKSYSVSMLCVWNRASISYILSGRLKRPCRASASGTLIYGYRSMW